jgi:hypothetical protein
MEVAAGRRKRQDVRAEISTCLILLAGNVKAINRKLSDTHGTDER